MRTGLLAEKMGMTRIFDQDGDHIPVTVLKVENCCVFAQRTEEKDGYSAVQVGYGVAKPIKIKQPQKGHVKNSGQKCPKKFAEFRVSADAMIEVGAEISVNHFVAGQYVDVSATSQGKGFAGGMKRHNFAGLEASHGVSISHRSLGSTGQCQDPGRVFKGKKMAGQMGNNTQTMQSLPVISVDAERGLVLVRGAVPGSKGGMVRISDAMKKALHPDAPFPAAFKEFKKAEAPKVEANNEGVSDAPKKEGDKDES